MDMITGIKNIAEVVAHGIELNWVYDLKDACVKEKLRVAVRQCYTNWREIHLSNIQRINEHLDAYISALKAIGQTKFAKQEEKKYSSLKKVSLEILAN